MTGLLEVDHGLGCPGDLLAGEERAASSHATFRAPTTINWHSVLTVPYLYLGQFCFPF